MTMSNRLMFLVFLLFSHQSLALYPNYDTNSDEDYSYEYNNGETDLGFDDSDDILDKNWLELQRKVEFLKSLDDYSNSQQDYDEYDEEKSEVSRSMASSGSVNCKEIIQGPFYLAKDTHPKLYYNISCVENMERNVNFRHPTLHCRSKHRKCVTETIKVSVFKQGHANNCWKRDTPITVQAGCKCHE